MHLPMLNRHPEFIRDLYCGNAIELFPANLKIQIIGEMQFSETLVNRMIIIM